MSATEDATCQRLWKLFPIGSAGLKAITVFWLGSDHLECIILAIRVFFYNPKCLLIGYISNISNKVDISILSLDLITVRQNF